MARTHKFRVLLRVALHEKAKIRWSASLLRPIQKLLPAKIRQGCPIFSERGIGGPPHALVTSKTVSLSERTADLTPTAEVAGEAETHRAQKQDVELIFWMPRTKKEKNWEI